METFVPPKNLAENPRYLNQRRGTLDVLDERMIDTPIVGLIREMNLLPYCFTLQCCFGHFGQNDQGDSYYLESACISDKNRDISYRLAYVCFCVENTVSGRWLLGLLADMPSVDPQYLQFGSAEWFWSRQVNTFVLQVQPERFKHKDIAVLSYPEALQVENVRDRFFDRLRTAIKGIERHPFRMNWHR